MSEEYGEPPGAAAIGARLDAMLASFQLPLASLTEDERKLLRLSIATMLNPIHTILPGEIAGRQRESERSYGVGGRRKHSSAFEIRYRPDLTEDRLYLHVMVWYGKYRGLWHITFENGRLVTMRQRWPSRKPHRYEFALSPERFLGALLLLSMHPLWDAP